MLVKSGTICRLNRAGPEDQLLSATGSALRGTCMMYLLWGTKGAGAYRYLPGRVLLGFAGRMYEEQDTILRLSIAAPAGC